MLRELKSEQRVDAWSALQARGSQDTFPCFVGDGSEEIEAYQAKNYLKNLTLIACRPYDNQLFTMDTLEDINKKVLILSAGSLQAPLTDEKVYRYKQALKKVLSEEYKAEIPLPQRDTDIARRTARGFLRHLTRGTLIKSGVEGEAYKDSLLLIEKCVDKKNDPELIDALRIEMQVILNNVTSWLRGKENLSRKHEQQLEIFINGLLALYPFVNPGHDEIVTVPQKIANQWFTVEYQFEKVDISPQTGLLSHLIEDQDRIYAYKLQPTQNKVAQPLLLLMGTPQPTGQGSALAVLENFHPGASIGEHHDLTKLKAWLEDDISPIKIKVIGQSKGAVMAMIIAARYPNRVSEAHCLASAGLAAATLNDLNKTWRSLAEESRPIIHVYRQGVDFVYHVDNGFLEGTRILHLQPDEERVSNYKPLLPRGIQKRAECHIQNFAGRASLTITRVDPGIENRSRWRELSGSIKSAMNYTLYPILSTELALGLTIRKLETVAPIARYITRPLAFVCRKVGLVTKVGLTLSATSATAVVAGVNIAAREYRNARSDYQLEMPKSATPIKFSSCSPGRDTTASLAARNLVGISPMLPSAKQLVSTHNSKLLAPSLTLDQSIDTTASLSRRKNI